MLRLAREKDLMPLMTAISKPSQAGLPSTGIPFVIVNRTIVVSDSKVLEGIYPGRAVRLPVR